MDLNEVYMTSAKKQFSYYKALGEKAIDQLEPEQLFHAANEDSNSIATIVKHLHGNMLSRWTDFLTADGEKPWRKRDEEFENEAVDKSLLISRWNEGWSCLFAALDSLQPEQLTTVIYIRNEGHTVIDAINRQLAHYSYHVGQIVFAAKIFKTSPWQSLSIPRNKSSEYNTAKFSNEKAVRHFTDEELKKWQ
jgi:hypothetical protein